MKNNKFYQQLINKLKINSSNSSSINLDLIEKAMCYAIDYHGDQKRASGEPFYSHPFIVAEMVADYYFDTDIIIASILHDIIEDTCVTFDMLKDLFGINVAQMVKELTRLNERYEKISIPELINNLHKNKLNHLLIIKLFDRIHNIKTIKYKPIHKMKETILETLNSFISISVYLEIQPLKRRLNKLSYVKLTKKTPLLH